MPNLLRLLLLTIALVATAPAHACDPAPVQAGIAHHDHHAAPDRPDDRHMVCKQALCCGTVEWARGNQLAVPAAWSAPEHPRWAPATTVGFDRVPEPPPPRAA